MTNAARDLPARPMGDAKHNFEIEGNGFEVKLPDDLTRGDTKTIDVDLKPGTYTGPRG